MRMPVYICVHVNALLGLEPPPPRLPTSLSTCPLHTHTEPSTPAALHRISSPSPQLPSQHPPHVPPTSIVIENEFGEINIDSELVASSEVLEGTGEQVTLLSNGCLCCTVRDDLVRALNSLWERRETIDHVIIETTGLANPGALLRFACVIHMCYRRVINMHGVKAALTDIC